ncbi:MAG: sulfatase-like hydrolase/transferase, partial [Anaerolineae bacterium]|nr:sulfatase-like hydrolase/transferase [Anaerolineae bacterium]
PEPWRSLYDPDEITLPPQFGADMRENPVFAATCGGRASHFRELFDPRTYRRMLAAYYGQISMIDHYLGQFFQRLRDDGLWDNTLLIFVSDHGDHNGAYGLFFKGQMYDSCCKVPLLIKAPDGSAGRRLDEVVNTLDLYGTILDYAGDAGWQAPGIEARSLVSLLRDEPCAWPNQTCSIIGADPARNLTMLRRDHLKLIRLARGDEMPLYELYDLRHEPLEIRDVFADAAYRAERDALQRDLDAWWREQAARYPRNPVSYQRRD